MRTLLFSVFILPILFLSGCKDSKTTVDPNSLQGTWNLIETLVDPGDGSGTFQPADYSKQITFFQGTTYVCTGSTCFMGNSSTSSSGTYDEVSLTLQPQGGCPNGSFPVHYKLENGYLIISYPCIEGCQEKYEKDQ